VGSRTPPHPPSREDLVSLFLPFRRVTADPVDNAELTVAPARHPWRWIATAVTAVLVAQFLHGLATNPGWDWPTFRAYFFEPSILRALGVTLELTAASTTPPAKPSTVP